MHVSVRWGREREGGRGDNGEGVVELMVGGSMSPEWEAVAMIKK